MKIEIVDTGGIEKACAECNWDTMNLFRFSSVFTKTGKKVTTEELCADCILKYIVNKNIIIED